AGEGGEHVAVTGDRRGCRPALGRRHLQEGVKRSILAVARARRAALGTHLLAVRVDKVRATIAEERRHEADPLFAPDDRDDVVAAVDGGVRALAHSSPPLIVGTLGAAFGWRSRISIFSMIEGRLRPMAEPPAKSLFASCSSDGVRCPLGREALGIG